MDFRDRFPTIKEWPLATMNKHKTPFPYNELGAGRLMEIPSPDDSTSFLFITHFAEPEGGGGGVFFSYGVEAPQCYPLRSMFECGKIGWLDFICHRNWLVELTSDLFGQGGSKARFVTPREIHPECIRELDELDDRGSPLHIVHERFLFNYRGEQRSRFKSDTQAKIYFDFLAKYGKALGITLEKIA